MASTQGKTPQQVIGIRMGDANVSATGATPEEASANLIAFVKSIERHMSEDDRADLRRRTKDTLGVEWPPWGPMPG